MQIKPSPFPPRSYPTRCRAYTIVEVVFALTILTIMFVSLFAGISFAFAVTQAERESLRATQVALQRLEGIRLFNWNQVTNTALNPTTFLDRYYPGAAGQPASGVTYTGAVQVADATLDPDPTYSSKLKRVTVTVTWSSGGVPRSRSISTFVGMNGIQNYIIEN